MRTRLPPATGTCQWLEPAANGDPRLEITVTTSAGEVTHVYEVVRSSEGGYNLLRADGDQIVCYTVRAVTKRLWTCTCPDAMNRPERACNCKHARALPAALRSLPF